MDLEDQHLYLYLHGPIHSVPDKTVDLFIPHIMAEHQQGVGDARGQREGVDQLPDTRDRWLVLSHVTYLR